MTSRLLLMQLAVEELLNVVNERSQIIGRKFCGVWRKVVR